MKLRSESYPDKIRRIARDLGQLQSQYDVERTIEKLRLIANELEFQLKGQPLNKR